ncbi:hypothetical protein Daus18300_000283 [Diaporthe australafricana]|uniref:Heterokaryon incompatibility domain-containing protein n=1 Tax=Diaporthe australafricana TaxID=127596 RepID=A0ABR3Y4I8_9PEZI
MRLIDAKTLRIREFPSEDAYPAYAILSHTWGPAEQECTLQSMTEPDISSRIGYTKIKHCCDQALKDGLFWAWVDTCCIDKTSTAELSEAINSMFRWYKKASICYAYIEDANTVEDLEKSRWITRGWTLQELVAPHDVAFFSKSWDLLGRKLELKDVLWHITGIESAVLESGTLSNVTVAKKMVGDSRISYL